MALTLSNRPEASVAPPPLAQGSELIPGLTAIEHAAIICLLSRKEGISLSIDHLHAVQPQVVIIKSEAKLRHHLSDLRDDDQREKRINQLRQIARSAMSPQTTS